MNPVTTARSFITTSAFRKDHETATDCCVLSVGDSPHVIGLLLALSALAIVIDPDHAPGAILLGLTSAALPWRAAWRGASGTALRPALIWVALALLLSCFAQLVALTEPLSTGRPMSGRLTYLSVLAILAALVSVLNARRPGERVWAGLMVLLVVVFMIPWLEEAGRMRRPQGVVLVHLDSPWTIFYGLLVVVGVTNYLPTRFGMAAACLGFALILEYLGLTRADWSLERRAVVWEWVTWTFALAVWVARWSASRTPSGSGFDRTWLWFRDHWGVVWALRNQERFNRTAELSGWPVRLSWYGLEPVDGDEKGRELPVPVEAEPAFRGLLRRFAQADRLDQVSASAGAPETALASDR
jgi:hypothetical protein